jgi:DNA polymerase-3 subunit gamma/tau
MLGVSLYRRYRPQSFDEVVGQTHVVRTMRNAVEQGKIHHAYLFVGSRGTGKTSIAKILARSLNCVNGPTLEPCGECESCRTIAASTSLDVIEMDAASNNSVEDIRDLREKVGFAPALGSWKVYILDEAHMLSSSAWNAFLKTLEEPPPHTIFVLATTEAPKVPATIVDRCHRFDFQRPSLEEISTVLRRIADAEGIGADDKTLALIGRSATGSFRDAIGTLDQLVTYGGPEVSYEAVLEVLGVADADLIFRTADALIAHDPGATLARVEELSSSGRDPTQFMRDLVAHLRHLVVVQTIGEAPDSFSVTADQTDRLIQQSSEITLREAIGAIDHVSAALAAVKDGLDERIQLELALLKSSSPQLNAPSGEREPVTVVEAPTPEAKEPVSPPEPLSTPKPAGEGLDAVWPAALEQVKAIEGGAMLAALLSGARPVTLDDSRLVISYPPSAAFSKRKVEDPVNRNRVAGALKLVTGKTLLLECELRDEDPPSEPGRFTRSDEFLSEEELIEKIKDVFDAEDVLEEA